MILRNGLEVSAHHLPVIFLVQNDSVIRILVHHLLLLLQHHLLLLVSLIDLLLLLSEVLRILR